MDQNQDKSPNNYFLTWRYLLFWISSLLSNIGSWMQQVAQPWLVLSLSNSAFWVGFTGFATTFPALLFTLPGGMLADRYDRKKVTLFFQFIQFLFVGVMLVLLIKGLLRVWMIIVISFIVGITDALSVPSFQTIIPSLVARKDIPRAVSLNSTQFNLSRVLGPVIAGIVIARYGGVACFSANAISYLPFFISIWFIYPRNRVKITTTTIQTKPVNQWFEIRDLLRIHAVRLPLVTVFAASFFCGPLVTFCPVIIKDVFHSGVGDFGWAMTAFGGGALIGAAVTFIPFRGPYGRNRIASAAAVLLGFIIIAIAMTHSFLLLSIMLVLAGITQIAANISANTFLQENAADNLRGRITSLYQLAMYSGLSIGTLFTGFMVSRLGIVPAFVINGSIAVIIQSALLLRQLHQPIVNSFEVNK